MTKNILPIAVFDSGVGGVSVLMELVNMMPHENFIYFGDTANAPYGIKSACCVRELTFSVYEKLKAGGIKAFVIACNTATSVAVAALREKYPEDIIIGIEPALKPAVKCCERPTVAVLATPLTLKEEKFSLLLQRFEDDARVIPFACPGLVEFVERGEVEGERLHAFLDELLAPLKKEELDAVVLGCTHYPFVKSEISSVIGENVQIFDGSVGTALNTRRRLEENNLLNDTNEKGRVIFIDSSYPNEENTSKSMLVKFGGEYLCS
ncbi:MAG: glutamate racemase [Clostridia bacterium]|nr:glutamate racemase [Clostridia bacterium]